MNERTENCPFSKIQATGRKFISPCCTASTEEFLVSGVYWSVSHVAGHGYGKPFRGSLDGINDTGTFVDKKGNEFPRHYNPKEEIE